MRILLAVVLWCCLIISTASSATADWLCDGDQLSIETIQGAVDIQGLGAGIPNIANGTMPGDGVLLRWRGMTLQLPRTNNAGYPSYTDGRWWWKAENSEHPEFKQRRGSVINYECDQIP